MKKKWTAKALYYKKSGNIRIINSEDEIRLYEVVLKKMYGGEVEMIDVVITRK